MNRSSRQLATFYLVMFALIFNAISSSAASSGKNGVLLCTSQGYKWVKVDSDTSSGEQAQQHCKLCLFPPSDDSFDPIIAACDSSFSFDDNGRQAVEHHHTIFKLRFARLTPQGRAPPFNTLSLF